MSANIPTSSKFWTIFGIAISIVGTVYYRIRSLKNENSELKSKELNRDLKDIEKDTNSLSDDELVDRENKYWNGKGGRSE